jgi:transposase
LVLRSRIILRCLKGESVMEIADQLQIRPNTVIKWRRRFDQKGLAGLADGHRSGKPVRYGAQFRDHVLATLELPPPRGQACWDGPAVAKQLHTSVHAVWRVLRKEGICLARQRSWCVSTDPEFAAKAAEVVGLYLNPRKTRWCCRWTKNPVFKRWSGPPVMWRPTAAKSFGA